MTDEQRHYLTRRGFIKGAGAAAAVSALALGVGNSSLRSLTALAGPRKDFIFAATDGWVSMPTEAAPIPPFFPDPAAPPSLTTYIMGFRDLTKIPGIGDLTHGVNRDVIMQYKNKAQLAAPLLYVDEGDDIRINLWNLGLAQRPDLTDNHTIHWHGFPRQVAYFDGVPDASLAASENHDLTYRYIPEDPGTYIYHCHVEDVEHVHMGLTGLVFVRPKMGPKFAYNDASTAFDRQFAILLTEMDAHSHFNDAHQQDTDWTDYAPQFRLMNGRAYPDTLAANGDPTKTTAGRLQFNPLSSRIQANAGEKVLLRISNIGFEEHSLVLPGMDMKMVGRDAKPLQAGRPDYATTGTRSDVQIDTYRLDLGPGESRDVIFTAPSVSKRTVYPFYDRNYGFTQPNNPASSYGGMRTEVRVFPGGLAAQTEPHQLVPEP